MSGRPILTAAQMREAECNAIAAGATVEGLMDRAGAAIAAIVADRWPGRSVLIACGPGNNGGDGYVAARLLRDRGFDVRVAGMRDPGTPAAKAARAQWQGAVEAFDRSTQDADIVIDALFGTGLKRSLEPAIAGWLRALGSEARVAVDLPSGVATDDGAVLGDVAAFDMTIALGALKPSHRLRPAADLCGEIVVADIGLDPAFVQGLARLASIGRPRLSAPPYDANKYTRGKVVVLRGAMAGAAMLAATAAQRSGAGYVELRGPVENGPPHALVRQPWADDALEDKRIGAIVCGPGLGHDKTAQAMLAAALASDHPLVLDADALGMLATQGFDGMRDRRAPAVLTPHEGEFARLFGEIGDDRLGAVRAAAEKAGAVVLLKGSASIVAHPDGRAAINPLAPSWLATAGTGDVLSGMMGTMLAQGAAEQRSPFDSAQAAVWLHADAARRAGPVLIADDLVTHLPATIAASL